MELQDGNHTPQRPKNFNGQRRNNVFYFSDNSARGILKRIPIKNGSYRMTELQTVLEKTEAARMQYEIWEDSPRINTGSSNYNKNKTDAKNADSYKSVHHDQKGETVRIKKSLSNSSKNLEIPKAYEDYSKTKINHKKPKKLRLLYTYPKETIFFKPSKGLEKNNQQTSVFLQIGCEKIKECVKEKKYENIFASNFKSNSSKNQVEYKDDKNFLRRKWTERSLNDALDKMQITEL